MLLDEDVEVDRRSGISSKHLSEVSSGKSREHSSQTGEPPKVILQPTLQNMKRMQLKN